MEFLKKFTKKDLVFSLITGVYTGVIAWQVFRFLNLPIFNKVFSLVSLDVDISSAWIIFLVPVLWILGVNLGYFLGRWLPFFDQFGKFSAIGFTNFSVYWGILNLFIASTNIADGIWYSVFVGIAFIAGAIHSYVWNKYWVFESGISGGRSTEIVKFITVSVASGLVNVGVASFIVNVSGPQFGIRPEGWANVGGVAGSAVALVFSFIGFRLLVFKKPVVSSQ